MGDRTTLSAEEGVSACMATLRGKCVGHTDMSVESREGVIQLKCTLQRQRGQPESNAVHLCNKREEHSTPTACTVSEERRIHMHKHNHITLSFHIQAPFYSLFFCLGYQSTFPTNSASIMEQRVISLLLYVQRCHTLLTLFR